MSSAAVSDSRSAPGFVVPARASRRRHLIRVPRVRLLGIRFAGRERGEDVLDEPHAVRPLLGRQHRKCARDRRLPDGERLGVYQYPETFQDSQRFRNDVGLRKGWLRHRVEDPDEQLRVRVRPHLDLVEGRKCLVGTPGRHGTLQREGDAIALVRRELREGAQRALHRTASEVRDDLARRIEEGLERVDLDRTGGGHEERCHAVARLVSMTRFIDLAQMNMQFLESCTPGYYNNEGRPAARSVRNGFYGAGSPAFIRLLEEWRARGDLNGLELA